MRATRLLGFAGLLAAGAACVLPMPRSDLAPHVTDAIPLDVPPGAPVIAVAPFADARDAEDRRSLRPPLRGRVLGMGRLGMYQTGDDAFLAPAAEAARADAMAVLSRSGLFSRVLPGDHADAARAEFVLEGALEELAGFRYQATELNLLAIGLWRHRADPPFGVARLRYRLLQGESQRWHSRIESRRESLAGSPAQAAYEALALSNERMAIALFRLLRPRAARRARSLPLQVLDACGLGETAVHRLVSDVNEVLVREAGVRLEPQVEVWTPPRSPRDAEALLAAVAQAAPSTGSLTLALATMPSRPAQPFARPRLGLARQLGSEALVDCAPDLVPSPLTVLHEIAHLFGALHVSDPNSPMNPVATFPARFFDPLNRQVLRAASGRPLGGPFPPVLIADLRARYEQGGRDGRVHEDELAEALAALGGGRR